MELDNKSEQSQDSGGRSRQISEFEDSLVNRVSPRIAQGDTEKPCLEKQTNTHTHIQTNKQTKTKPGEKN